MRVAFGLAAAQLGGIPDSQFDRLDVPGGGGSATHAMLAGSIDVVNAGPGNWKRLDATTVPRR